MSNHAPRDAILVRQNAPTGVELTPPLADVAGGPGPTPPAPGPDHTPPERPTPDPTQPPPALEARTKARSIMWLVLLGIVTPLTIGAFLLFGWWGLLALPAALVPVGMYQLLTGDAVEAAARERRSRSPASDATSF